MKSFLTIGHRGAAGHEPENTLRSLRRALEMGADGVEIDVRLSADGALMVFHDAKLRRITGARGTLASQTAAQLRRLDAGKGERIPTLPEVLDLLDGKHLLNIELKAPGTAAPTLRALRHSLEKGALWNSSNLIISSFDRRELLALRTALDNCPVTGPRTGVGLLLARRPLSLKRWLEAIRPTSLHLSRSLPGLIKRGKQHDLRVLIYTVNEIAEMRHLRDLGADGIFTDFPDRAVDL